jgi:RNA polymerase sigma factor (sigma-70 family)
MKPTSNTTATRFGTAALRVLSDERLSRLAAGGDRAAFAVIFDRYQQELFAYCASILRDRDDAADAVQSTMLRAMRALDGEEREIAVRPWLYRIAHNEAIELLRRPRTEPDTGAEVVTVGSVEADAAVRAHLRAVLKDIQGLPDRQRSALVMRELSGLSYTDIGAALMTSEAGAKQAVYDARQALHDLAKGRDSDCETIRRRISDGDRRVFRGRAIRAHLTACTDCRAWQAELAARETSWAAFTPAMPAAAATALHTAAGGGAGAGAGAAGAASVAGVTASGPTIATVAIAVVLGAGAVGVHELRKGDDPGEPQAIAGSQTPAASAPAGREAAKRSGKAHGRSVRSRGGNSGDARTRAERARARAQARATKRPGSTSADPDRDNRAGAGSTALGGAPTGARGSSTRSGGNGIKSAVGGGRRGGGAQPIRDAIGETRGAVQGTVNQVQEALPVPTPEVTVPTVRPPRGGGAP